jgi:AbiV family abortive infection protein
VKITRDVVLEGLIHHTLEARSRLEDGLTLFEQGRYGSAVILGTIALENIGRANWLAALVDDETRRDQLTAKAFIKALRNLDHQENLKLGLVGFSMDNAPTISVQQLQMQHDDWETIWVRNLEAIYSAQRRAPSALHEVRARAQYPELSEAGCSWKSSADVTVEMARNSLRQAADNFYLLQTFGLKNIKGLRESAQSLGEQDAILKQIEGYVDPYRRLGII